MLKKSLFSFLKSTLFQKLAFFSILLVLGTLITSIFFLSNIFQSVVEDQIGQRALAISKTISLMPEVISLVEQKDPEHKLEQIIASIEKSIDARFIVIGDEHSIRLTHPTQELIGKRMVGADNDEALQYGHYYISKATGTLGPSIRGKSPIIDQNGKIIGVVSVGYLEENIKKIIAKRHQEFLLYFYIAIFVTLLLAIAIAATIKKTLLGYEPTELSRLFLEKQAILNAVKAAIIATNPQGKITLFNELANHYFHLEDALRAPKELEYYLMKNTEMKDVSIDIENIEYVCNLSPIVQDNQTIGMVASCRKKEEMDALVWELTRVKQYSERLREKKHEFSNLLHLISGYIQIGEYDKAIDLISQSHLPDEKTIEHFQTFIHDPVVASIFIGKYYFAFDKGVELILDENSSVQENIDVSISKHLLTILGNIINNAIDAAQQSEQKKVTLFATDTGNDLIFEVEDSGGGIDETHLERIFERGFTTKDELHSGYGLHFVKSTLEALGGFVSIDKGIYGTIMTVHIPKGKSHA